MMKSEFAKRCNVDKSRVSQWLKAKQIDGAAVVGTGRSAKLDAALAPAQLALRLATDERFGLNGLNTNLDWNPDEVADDEDEAEIEAELEADRKRYVTLLAAKSAVDELWVCMDQSVQAALRPHPAAAAAYAGIRDRLAEVKWRIQGVEPRV
jgi:transcriptional regulator with XRE-family HTH domain